MREYKIKVDFNNYENTRLQQGVEKTEMTMSAYVRMLLLEADVRPAPPAKLYKWCPEVKKCIWEIELLIKRIDSRTATIEKLEEVVIMLDAFEAGMQKDCKSMLNNAGKRRTRKGAIRSMAEHRIEVKISDSELENLDKMTKKMKTSRSEVIRMLLSNSKVHEKTREDLHEFTRELSTLRFGIEALVQRIDNDEDAQDYLHKVVQEIMAVHNEIVEEYLC